MRTTVNILGCGPAGLLAAHAASKAGYEFRIYSKKKKSVIPGSMHLHGPIPGITSLYPEGTIQFVRLGTEEDYARKVYADPEHATGWDNYDQTLPSWKVPAAYDKLWRMYENQIVDTEIHRDQIPMLFSGKRKKNLVISTIPQPGLCYGHHTFNSVPYWIQPLPTPDQVTSEIVVYNGLPHDFWYRWSVLGGLCSIESTQRINGSEVMQGYKAIGNNCDCYSKLDGFHRVGRWSEWRHGVVLWQVYNKVKEILGDV